MSKVLALDFDGVIWDSAGECFQVGWRAYQELTGEVLSDRTFERGFIRGRPLARTGHDFYILLKLMHDDPERDLAQMTLEEFGHERGVHAEMAAKFDRIFYLLRAHFRDTEPEQWASWQQPYPELLKVMDEWESSFQGVALATTKDTDSAGFLMKTTGRQWPVFGKEFSEHKADQIEGISQHFHVETEHILFVDDIMENLDQVRPTRARCVMADWGYNLPESRQEAVEHGYQVVSLEGLPNLFREFLDS